VIRIAQSQQTPPLQPVASAITDGRFDPGALTGASIEDGTDSATWSYSGTPIEGCDSEGSAGSPTTPTALQRTED